MNAKSVTLKEIAKLAGVSTAAVSKALRGEKDISKDTQERIKKIANSLGYSPNNLAIYLRNGNIKALGVLIPDNTNPYNAIVLKGVEEKAKEYGYTVIIANTNSDVELEYELLQTMVSLKIRGILAIPTQLRNYKDITIPLVMMSRYPYYDLYSEYTRNMLGRDFDYIVNDDFTGEYIAAEHLISRGIKKIFLIAGDNEPDTASGVMNLTRLEGYKKALETYHIPFEPDRVCFNVLDIHESYQTVKRILNNEEPPFGLCLYSDYLAMGALSAINDRHMKIPEEVALVGYDDIENAKYTVPAITTINQLKYTMGAESVEHVIHSMKGKNHPWKKILKPTLVIRDTT